MAHHELEPLRRMGLLARRPDERLSAAPLLPHERIGVLSVETRPLADCAGIERPGASWP